MSDWGQMPQTIAVPEETCSMLANLGYTWNAATSTCARTGEIATPPSSTHVLIERSEFDAMVETNKSLSRQRYYYAAGGALAGALVGGVIGALLR